MPKIGKVLMSLNMFWDGICSAKNTESWGLIFCSSYILVPYAFTKFETAIILQKADMLITNGNLLSDNPA